MVRMVVPDCNILIDFFLGEPYFNEAAQRGWRKDALWICPSLWRYELGHVLLRYVRNGLISQAMMESFITESEKLITTTIDEVDFMGIARIAVQKNISVYDASYCWVAQDLGVKLWTRDQKLLNAFPGIAVKEL